MASDGNDRSGLLTAGGILSIVAGALEIAVARIVVSSIAFCEPFYFGLWPVSFEIWPVSIIPHICWEYSHRGYDWVPTWVFIGGGLFLLLGILAIVGGISAIKRKSFGLSLVGAICALPSVILGILAVIFISPARKEFRGED